MHEIILPAKTSKSQLGTDQYHVSRMEFSDGSSVVALDQGYVHKADFVLNPNQTPIHPPTNESPGLRMLMGDLAHKIALVVFITGDIPDGVKYGNLYKDDDFGRYVHSANWLMDQNLLPADFLDDSPYTA